MKNIIIIFLFSVVFLNCRYASALPFDTESEEEEVGDLIKGETGTVNGAEPINAPPENQVALISTREVAASSSSSQEGVMSSLGNLESSFQAPLVDVTRNKLISLFDGQKAGPEAPLELVFKNTESLRENYQKQYKLLYKELRDKYKGVLLIYKSWDELPVDQQEALTQIVSQQKIAALNGLTQSLWILEIAYKYRYQALQKAYEVYEKNTHKEDFFARDLPFNSCSINRSLEKLEYAATTSFKLAAQKLRWEELAVTTGGAVARNQFLEAATLAEQATGAFREFSEQADAGNIAQARALYKIACDTKSDACLAEAEALEITFTEFERFALNLAIAHKFNKARLQISKISVPVAKEKTARAQGNERLAKIYEQQSEYFFNSAEAASDGHPEMMKNYEDAATQVGKVVDPLTKAVEARLQKKEAIAQVYDQQVEYLIKSAKGSQNGDLGMKTCYERAAIQVGKAVEPLIKAVEARLQNQEAIAQVCEQQAEYFMKSAKNKNSCLMEEYEAKATQVGKAIEPLTKAVEARLQNKEPLAQAYEEQAKYFIQSAVLAKGHPYFIEHYTAAVTQLGKAIDSFTKAAAARLENQEEIAQAYEQQITCLRESAKAFVAQNRWRAQDFQDAENKADRVIYYLHQLTKAEVVKECTNEICQKFYLEFTTWGSWIKIAFQYSLRGAQEAASGNSKIAAIFKSGAEQAFLVQDDLSKRLRWMKYNGKEFGYPGFNSLPVHVHCVFCDWIDKDSFKLDTERLHYYVKSFREHKKQVNYYRQNDQEGLHQSQLAVRIFDEAAEIIREIEGPFINGSHKEKQIKMIRLQVARAYDKGNLPVVESLKKAIIYIDEVESHEARVADLERRIADLNKLYTARYDQLLYRRSAAKSSRAAEFYQQLVGLHDRAAEYYIAIIKASLEEDLQRVDRLQKGADALELAIANSNEYDDYSSGGAMSFFTPEVDKLRNAFADKIKYLRMMASAYFAKIVGGPDPNGMQDEWFAQNQIAASHAAAAVNLLSRALDVRKEAGWNILQTEAHSLEQKARYYLARAKVYSAEGMVKGDAFTREVYNSSWF